MSDSGRGLAVLLSRVPDLLGARLRQPDHPTRRPPPVHPHSGRRRCGRQFDRVRRLLRVLGGEQLLPRISE